MVKKIAHIGIAVRDLEEASAVYRDVLGLEEIYREEVKDQKVKTVVFAAGESHVELLSPTSPESPIAKFLDKRGEGIHHVAYAVEDLEAKLADLGGKGARLIDEKPRVGAGGHLIAFIHPKSAKGVLTEMTQLVTKHEK
ncbi:MAG: methylmalonyl-CoA epimerase [Deltaproteobacteria bacterium]|nr:methylmalonyl-CoA epimerase [Deltaproteobacteria bacterium]